MIGVIIAIPVVLFLGIQLIPAWLLQNNPPVLAEPKWDSPQTRELAQRACFDCHSNETVWPWYSRVAPVSWLATLDTVRGRRRLNFSEWGLATGGEGGESGEGGEGGGEIGEVISNGQMPPASYVALHPQANLTDAEKQQLIAGLEASLK
ncbi:MAG: heme-binding domain-containing protein [Chloroflexi bacterium]|nr:heme-binding domain-containing protein [Chloroflexota bacterium]